jgi:hypothetical protein
MFQNMKSHQPLPLRLEYDARLVRTRLGAFYLCIPQPLDKVPESQGPRFTTEEKRRGAGVIALDPGVRTFQTGYDTNGRVVEWGAKDLSRIYRLCYAHDDLQSRWS